MLIAKIIKSNSHVDYVARVLDSLETAQPPTLGDYHFGQFVKVECGDCEVVGVIYNSQLINPEYGNFGPRLSTPGELNTVFSPDYLHEQGVLVGLLLLGWRGEGNCYQRVPRTVLPINSSVETMTDEEVGAFHYGNGALQLAYYAHVRTHAGAFAFQLLASILDQLEELAREKDRARLDVLRRTMAWQQTLGRIA
jgi:hypothetical protein